VSLLAFGSSATQHRNPR